MARYMRRVGADGLETEASFQARVVGLLRVYEWGIQATPRVGIYHAQHGGHNGRTIRGGLPEGRGFPDLLAVHELDRRLLVAELKDETGRVGPGQAEWIAGFNVIGDALEAWHKPWHMAVTTPKLNRLGPVPRVEAYLWRPSDWDELHDVIRGGRPRRRDLDPPPGLE